MATPDISWRAFFICEGVLVAAYVLTATLYLSKSLSSALYGLAVCIGLILALFGLAYRTIGYRGPFRFKPHPRFPSGKHPRPKLQVLFGMLLFSGLQLAMFWRP
jgi:steroid 5-alpha reductase family enzyme